MLSNQVFLDIDEAMTESDVQAMIRELASDYKSPRICDSEEWFWWWGLFFKGVRNFVDANGHMPESWHDRYRRNIVRMWEAAAFERKAA